MKLFKGKCHQVLLSTLLVLSVTYQADAKPDYRNHMRQFIIGMSKYAKKKEPSFVIIPQNGQELITTYGSTEDYEKIQYTYLNAIDGHGRENLFYGYPEENMRTPEKEKQWMIAPLKLARANEKTILVTDYTKYPSDQKKSYIKNDTARFISYAAPYRQLDYIPKAPPHNAGKHSVTSLSEAKNFLYLLDSSHYATRELFLKALANTDYDIILIDAFYNDGTRFTPKDIKELKKKKNGAPRLVIAYMSIGEAETYRYYWKESWYAKKPTWLDKENPHWKGNFKVKYWHKDWQKIIYGTKKSYLDRIIAQGFDGAYLDIVDAFYHFEES